MAYLVMFVEDKKKVEIYSKSVAKDWLYIECRISNSNTEWTLMCISLDFSVGVMKILCASKTHHIKIYAFQITEWPVISKETIAV